MKKNEAYCLAALAATLVANALLSLMTGKDFMPPGKLVEVLSHPGSSSTEYVILTGIRMPRLVAAYVVGAGLAVVGCVLQSVFLNPLCESYTLGISSSAAIGVTLGSMLSLPLSRFSMAVAGSITGAGALWLVGYVFLRTVDVGFVLAGVVLNFFASGVIILLTLLFDPYRINSVLLWLLGGFSSLEPSQVYFSAPLILACLAVLFAMSRNLDVMVLGREKSVSLGVNVSLTRNAALALCVVISTLCVSLAGVVSFVGIIVPNVVKELTGLAHSRWMAFSALAGALLVSLADNLSRTMLFPVEIPVSVFTGLIGTVFFIVHMTKRRN